MLNRFLFRIVLFVGITFLSYSTFAQTTEACNDGIDNDGDGKIDCTDTDCIFVATIEKGCRCFDGIDNDGDTFIDQATLNA